MYSETNKTPTVSAEAVRLISVVMGEDPRELKELGLSTVYKHPRTNVLSVCELVNANLVGQSSSSAFFSNISSAASTGYLVQLSVPEDCYSEVLELLKSEPLITKINDNKTASGQAVENKISEMVSDEASSQNSCCIM